MRRAPQLVMATCAAALPLSGCVAALAPLAAGGAILGGGLRTSDDAAPRSASAATTPSQRAALENEVAALGYTIVDSMPEPARKGVEGTSSFAMSPGGYNSFTQYSLALSNEANRPQGTETALLADPARLNADRIECRNGPLAVLIDLDPEHGQMPLTEAAPTDPMLAVQLAQLRDAGIVVVWISSHGPEAAQRIRDILTATGLDPAGDDPLILMRFAGERKQARRTGLADAYCLIAIAGDRRADFDDLYDYLLDPVLAAPLEVMIGEGWFLTPPPLASVEQRSFSQ